MDEGALELASAIGARVRQERHSRGWTLDQLAEAAGVSRRMVVNVEQGAVNPSVGTLLRLAEALRVGLPALVEPPRTQPVKVTRRGERATLWRGAGGGCGLLVAAFTRPDVFELWDWTLEPGDHRCSDAHPPGARELLAVLEGSVVVEIGDQTVVLDKADAIAFPGDVAHSYANDTASPARFSLAVFEPRGQQLSRSER